MLENTCFSPVTDALTVKMIVLLKETQDDSASFLF